MEWGTCTAYDKDVDLRWKLRTTCNDHPFRLSKSSHDWLDAGEAARGQESAAVRCCLPVSWIAVLARNTPLYYVCGILICAARQSAFDNERTKKLATQVCPAATIQANPLHWANDVNLHFNGSPEIACPYFLLPRGRRYKMTTSPPPPYRHQLSGRATHCWLSE